MTTIKSGDIIFSDASLRNPEGFTLKFAAQWDSEVSPLGVGSCESNFDGSTLRLRGSCIPLGHIAHEVTHAVQWFATLNAINGHEDEAYWTGQWTEDVIAAFLRAGWTFGVKTNEGVIWNTDVAVALIAPKEQSQ